MLQLRSLAAPYACVFTELIEKSYRKYGQRVIILIDEYDKLILDNLDQPEMAKEAREILKDFYTIIKDSDEFIKFAFLTGVSKFARVSIFSGLNNLKDITLDRRYATICGYTQHDLETVFADHLQNADMPKVREWYNGYNFLGEPVYNPFDILLLSKMVYFQQLLVCHGQRQRFSSSLSSSTITLSPGCEPAASTDPD